MEKIGLSAKFIGRNYFRGREENIFFAKINFLDTIKIHFQENFFSLKTNFK